MDIVKPKSNIKNITSFQKTYNKPVTIKANANDDKSGVRTVALFYRFLSGNKNWGNWILFSDIKKPYEWLFNGKSIESKCLS